MTLTFDPHVKRTRTPPPIDTSGTDWGDVAEVHWIEAQLCALTLDDELHAIATLEERLAQGDVYRTAHPKCIEGLGLYRDLENQRRDRMVTVNILRWRIWEACRTTQMALTRTELGRRVQFKIHMGMNSYKEPEALWRTLMGNAPIPAGKAEDVEPIIRVEPWLLEVLRERLAERGERTL